jgi:hypothetical protein
MFHIAKSTIALPLLAGVLSLASMQTSVDAAAVRTDAGFTATSLAANDDGSTGLINTGISFNFFGVSGPNLYVNNNGNVTFNSPLSTFTPFGLLTATNPIIAPFFADVDTRNPASNLVKYGTSTVDGHAAFGVNWVDVGYFSNAADKLNSFQLVLIDRSDIAPGDFDFEFNYDQIEWETGGASGGSGGLGGSSARVGWTNGGATDFELGGSGVNGAFLDGGSNSLIRNSLNSNVDGRYVFQVRNGVVINTPEGGQTLALLGLGLLTLAGVRKAVVRK